MPRHPHVPPMVNANGDHAFDRVEFYLWWNSANPITCIMVVAHAWNVLALFGVSLHTMSREVGTLIDVLLCDEWHVSVGRIS